MGNEFTKQKPLWPEKAANDVEGAARALHHGGALGTVQMIRDDLFGSADKMQLIAQAWGEAPYMTNSLDVISSARTNLQPYWQGGGFDAFNTYVGQNVEPRFQANEAHLNGLMGIVSGCIEIVYQTYSDALKLLIDTAHNVANAFIETGKWSMIIAAPPAAPIAAAMIAKTVVSALNDFARDVATLISAQVPKIGQLRSKEVVLSALGNDFQTLPALHDSASAAESPDMWGVKPPPKV